MSEVEQQTAVRSENPFDGLGCQLLFTESLEEAKGIIRAARLAGIVLDTTEAGEQALSQVKQIAAVNNESWDERLRTNLIVIGFALDIFVVQQILKLGASEFLLSPVNSNRLRSAVNAACSKQDGSGQNANAAGPRMILMIRCPQTIEEEVVEEETAEAAATDENAETAESEAAEAATEDTGETNENSGSGETESENDNTKANASTASSE